MNYEASVRYLLSLGRELAAPTQATATKFDLENITVLAERLGRPDRVYPTAHIAGTNGKGSTAAFLESILRLAGLLTRLNTSPHLEKINERIRMDGAEISDQGFAETFTHIHALIEELLAAGKLRAHPTYFECVTAIAFEYFARERVDIAVLEVGMGGRLDATNVVEPRVSVITDVSLDHHKFLGDTIPEIAREKAGIIRADGIVVTLPQTPEANDVIGNTILSQRAKAVSAVPYVPPVSPQSAPYLFPSTQAEGGYVSRYPLQVMGKQITVETPLVGRHQLRNIALAIAAAEQLSQQGFATISAAAIERGMRETHWPGRFQVLPASPDYPADVFDVAHNPGGAWALRSTLSAFYEEPRLIFVFGVMRDKSIGEMAEILFPLADRVIATHVNNPRSAIPAEIREAARRVSVEIDEASDVAS